jgi:hypothetical protein
MIFDERNIYVLYCKDKDAVVPHIEAVGFADSLITHKDRNLPRLKHYRIAPLLEVIEEAYMSGYKTVCWAGTP